MKNNASTITAIALVALALGYFAGSRRPADHAAGGAASADASVKFWTCSMHPQIRQPKPGKCPICAMDLIPVREGREGDLGPRELRLSDAAARLADVAVTPVVRRIPEMRVRLVGKIEYDETRLAYITARFPGRMDRLYVDYTGVAVKQGDHLASIYSPELLTAQQELIQAKRSAAELRPDTVPGIRDRARATLQSAREKLRLWDLTAEQIRQIELSEDSSDHLQINSPISGVVIHKNAVEGVYLKTGERIYTIADLSRVWVKLDAYESDLQWIHYGQEVEFETEAYPGEIFRGRISFMDPVLNARTRTVKVRVNVDNGDGRLKPDMFVRAVVKSKIATGGRVMDPVYAGKWISPMHPEIVSEKPGKCTICGMDLVPAETLGYAAVTNAAAAPLVIPASAPLITGQRAVVYVTSTNRPGVFAGREVVLGPRAGGFYIVKEGLKAGELVVVSGNFKIDSAIQILAKPSMMSGAGDEGRGAGGMHDHGAGADSIEPLSAPPLFVKQLQAVVDAYAVVGGALDHDRVPATAAVVALKESLGRVQMELLAGDAHMAWMGDLNAIGHGLKDLEQAKDIDASRQAFEHVSSGLIAATKRFTDGTGIFEFHCPMAFENKGANWLQTGDQIRNPYFGAKMLKCGEMVRGTKGEGQGAGAGKGAK